MSSDISSPEERKEFVKYLKLLCLKSTQLIVQGRLGKTISTESIVSQKNAMINLTVKDYPEIEKEARAAIRDGIPNKERSYVIEISLRTSDADSLVLEVWSIGLTNKCENKRDHETMHYPMSHLLKSLLCLSRVTPAYKLSRKQGNEYVICYRVYMGEINLSGLGEGFKVLRVGSAGTHWGTITMSAAYRTTENLHVSTKGISPKVGIPFVVKTDHFSSGPRPHVSSPARPCHTLQSRLRTFSDASDGMQPSTESSSPPYNVFNTAFSVSPAGNFIEKDGNKVMFTVGTPPGGNPRCSVSSPALARMQRLNITEKNNFHSSNNGERSHTDFYKAHWSPDKSQFNTGASAPNSGFTGHLNSRRDFADLKKDRRVSFPSTNFLKEPLSNNRKPLKVVKPNEQVISGTTFWHWDATSTSTVSPKPVPHISPQFVSNSEVEKKSNSPVSSPLVCTPPGLMTGAFVLGCKTAQRAKETLEAAEISSLPFRDLLKPIHGNESPDDESSQSSTSLESDEKSNKDRFAEGRRKSSDSSSSLSLTGSTGTLNNENLQKHPDDFVLVDLKPAFARDDSIKDLGTFYRECENVPELIMFENHGGSETDETLHDLTKQLEDYEKDMHDFDQFVSELCA
ncbi:autophagy-related protein 13-like [Clavelina lepadiformis]|uniref:autophagy-related protein 13-like n=1 Tax=Clavelina lepadiformis TaxID=159417 RepID=UPI0040415B73